MARGGIKFSGCGQAIKEARERRGVGQLELGRRLGWSTGRLCKYEKNQLTVTDWILENIARGLGLFPLRLIIDCLLIKFPELTLEGRIGELRRQLYAAIEEEEREESK